MATCTSTASLVARSAAPRRGGARRASLAVRASSVQQPSPDQLIFPWRNAVPVTAGQGPPPVMPRFAGMRGDPTDPMALLMQQRIVFLGTQVDDFSADAVVSQILYLDALDSTKDIKLFINSPGGSVTAGMGIYDAIQMCRCDVSTVCFGLAASMGAFLLAAGTKGKRMSMPNARIMIHQPLGGASGQAVDIEIQAKEIMYHKGNLNRILAFHTGQPVEKVDEDTDRDRYMSPIEAKEYGLIDVIVGGDDKTLRVAGDPKDFLKTREAYIAWGNEDGDRGDRASRFLNKPRIPTTDVPGVGTK